MENKKGINSKLVRNLNREIAPEPVLKAPPPTPCISVKQRSGSVPDVRIVDVKKEKLYPMGIYHRNLTHAAPIPVPSKLPAKAFFSCDCKRSTSDHGMCSGIGKTGPWSALVMGPCTSNLLHSVRQRLMNL